MCNFSEQIVRNELTDIGDDYRKQIFAAFRGFLSVVAGEKTNHNHYCEREYPKNNGNDFLFIQSIGTSVDKTYAFEGGRGVNSVDTLTKRKVSISRI